MRHAMLPSHGARARGVTFLEVLVVAAVLAILVAVAVPNFAGVREGAALKSAVRGIAAAGLLARQMAVSQGRETQLLLDTEGGEWWIDLTVVGEDATSREEREAEEKTSYEQPTELPARVSFGKFRTDAGEAVPDRAGHVVLTFHPNGTCTALAVELRNRRGESMTVDFDRGTARPWVYDGEPKTLAEKLKMRGVDPTLYGLEAPAQEAAGDAPGAGFYRSAGQTEEERVASYKTIADRIAQRARTQFEIDKQGNAATVYGADAFGGGGSAP